MMRASMSGVPPAPGSVLLRLRSLLTRPIRLERRGIDWHFVFAPPPRAPAIQRVTEQPARRRDEMPSMTPRQVAEVCASLRTVLGGEIGRHPRMPSLALLERALVKNGERGVDDVPAAVLRHAAQSLDLLELDQVGPGLVVLRRRVEQVLRRRHGDGRSREPRDHALERATAALAAGDFKDFSDSLTEFIDLDKLFGDPAP
jgi:hypothetical protein